MKSKKAQEAEKREREGHNAEEAQVLSVLRRAGGNLNELKRRLRTLDGAMDAGGAPK